MVISLENFNFLVGGGPYFGQMVLHIDTMDLSSNPSRRGICVWYIMKSVPLSFCPKVCGSSPWNLRIFKSFRTRLSFSLGLSIIPLAISTRNLVASVFLSSYVVARTLHSREIEFAFHFHPLQNLDRGLVRGTVMVQLPSLPSIVQGFSRIFHPIC